MLEDLVLIATSHSSLSHIRSTLGKGSQEILDQILGEPVYPLLHTYQLCIPVAECNPGQPILLLHSHTERSENHDSSLGQKRGVLRATYM